MVTALAPLLVMIGMATAAAQDELRPQWSRVPDGTEVLVVSVPGARTTSLRLVFRAGSANDPDQRAGLAHLVEHLIFHGTYGLPGLNLQHTVRGAGGLINAVTSPDYVAYMLDVPSDRAAEVIPLFVRTVTNPALGLANVTPEKSVIATENTYHSALGWLWVLDGQLFSQLSLGQTVIGTKESRAAIKPADILSFYGQYYRPSRSTFVVVGDVQQETVQQWLQGHSLLPPSTPEERTVPVPAVPTLPIMQTTRAPFSATLIGYALHRDDPLVCRDVAMLISWRLRQELMARTPMVASVDAECRRLRGNPFLLVRANSNALDTGELPESLRKACETLKDTPPSTREKQLLQQRFKNIRANRHTPTGVLADRVVERITAHQDDIRKQEVDTLFTPPASDPGRVKQMARDSLVGSRSVLIHYTPMEG